MLRGFIFQKKLQEINVVMNSFEWKQNEHKILAFVVFSPKDLPQQHFSTRIKNEEITNA